ncbi:hypothetical protein [Fusibacter ferrireducens]|uniref:Uncharacterized protein n=1 Tax=Fusibacter ferrireducens TaxID=2785058 RepID=A0ABR9ZME8_9FIRM|nr:hypothetical protein [Fusibacter ferrireducens]MBF4691642.1 hypothetical protein [Fusibacter ferrireducens]
MYANNSGQGNHSEQIASFFKTWHGVDERDEILKIALKYALSLSHVQELLLLSGHPKLYVRNPRDAVIIYSIVKQQSLERLNLLLRELNEKLL